MFASSCDSDMPLSSRLRSENDYVAAIAEIAAQKKWHHEPFIGLMTQLRQDIRVHDQETNQMYCQSFWPNQQCRTEFSQTPRQQSLHRAFMATQTN